MKVLHLISSGGMYGAEAVVATLASNLQNLGEDTIVGIFDNAHRPRNDASDRIEKAGVKVIRIPCRDAQTAKRCEPFVNSFERNKLIFCIRMVTKPIFMDTWEPGDWAYQSQQRVIIREGFDIHLPFASTNFSTFCFFVISTQSQRFQT